MKHFIGLRQSTGDLYAIPLAAAIAIGRIGCFLTGLPDNTYGTPTNLPWAVNFGDGIPRHPTQIYEMIFLLALIPILYSVLKKISSNNIVIPSASEPLISIIPSETPITPVILSEDCASLREAQPQSKDPVFSAATTGPTRHFNREGHDFSRAATPGERPPAVAPPLSRSGREGGNHTLFLPGDAFKLFMVAYMSFRLLCDFIKPYPRLLLGLGGIQWVCVLILLYYLRDIIRWLIPSESRLQTQSAPKF